MTNFNIIIRKGVFYNMAEGSMKIARELLSLEPTAVVELYSIYPDYQKRKDVVFNVHNGSLFGGDIFWQGVKYSPLPIEIEGFEAESNGRLSRPTFRVSNKDLYVSDLLSKWDDFINARIVRKRTFVKFIDDENFDGGNPFGEEDPTAELTNQVFVVSQKKQENKVFVELELTTPLDLDNSQINSRRILAKFCYWKYRANGCNYTGAPLQKCDGLPFYDIEGNIIDLRGSSFNYGDPNDEYDDTKVYNTGDWAYIENPNVVVSDPEGFQDPKPALTYYVALSGDVSGINPEENSEVWAFDGCNKNLSSCKLRFGEGKIPFGGFPGTDGFNFRSNS
ncbi:MAG: phage minor tail protein L [Candidatus Lokiarchaeota archaeon]|nr:phage minor tail protein L [Candidatus Lokiarchaeota archaeon]